MKKKTNSKVYHRYSSLSSFFWRSELTEERKKVLIAWEANLSDSGRRNLHDLLDDERDSEADHWAQDAAGIDI